MIKKITTFTVTIILIVAISITGFTPFNVEASPASRVMENIGYTLQLYPQILEDWYAEFKEKSIVSTGTNGRLDAFLQKLNNGEHVIVVANGGSITEGSGASEIANSYADRFVYGLKTRYPNAEIEYLNVGISAQPSSIGIMNYDRDITLVLGNRAPDLVLIEYAVNDEIDPTDGSGYESMIRKALENDNTAVMLMFSVFKNEYTKQSKYIPMGEKYGLPMVSMKNCLLEYFESGLIRKDYYFWDALHPSDFGHFLMSECLLQLIDDKQAEIDEHGAAPITSVLSGGTISYGDYTHLMTISSGYAVDSNDDGTASIYFGDIPGVTLDTGSFSARDYSLRDSRRFDDYPFANNFMHDMYSGDDPFVITAEFGEVLINYKTAFDYDIGTALVFVDDVCKGTLEGYDDEGFKNSTCFVVRMGENVGRHTLRIEMDTASKNKKFTIYNIALK